MLTETLSFLSLRGWGHRRRNRYVLLLFPQPAGFDNQTLVTPNTPISNFNISAFAAEVGLGNPLGGTFMLVGPDANSTAA